MHHWIKLAIGLVAISFLVAPLASAQTQFQTSPVSRIAFGSCIRQDRSQPIWQAISDYQPQLFVLTGDNIYGDSDDVEILKIKYDQLCLLYTSDAADE